METENEKKSEKKSEVQAAKKETEPSAKPKASQGDGEIAIIRVRGVTGVNKSIQDTMLMLNLHRKNYCTIVPANPSMIGMIRKVKDFVTYGEIDAETKKMLINKRSERDPKDAKKLKPFFRLSPPKKGFGRKGIKVAFSVGGALGNRGEKINDLIKRMIY